jgi:phosphopentomutase
VLDDLAAAGRRVMTIGKIDDLFTGKGIASAVHTVDNRDGMRCVRDAVNARDADFVFANLVDFDTMWGHRNDARAYALGLEEFDAFLGELLPTLSSRDLLMITSDHGNDPTTVSTDHSRECVPLIAYHSGVGHGHSVGVRTSLADLGATVAAAFGLEPRTGVSFLTEVS